MISWGEKIDFFGEIFVTNFGENGSDSLKLLSKISPNLVKFLGNHQIW